MKKTFAIGLDLGLPGETSGLAVVEGVIPAEFERDGYCRPELMKLYVRYLHRHFPRTTYTGMGDHMSEVLDIPELALYRDQIGFVADQTAVAASVVELIERRVGKRARRVVIEGRHKEDYSNGLNYIPKKNLVGGIHVSLELCNLKIARDLDETQNFVQELANYQNRPSSAASLSGDSWREEQSDDLVLATGIACWTLQYPAFFGYDRR
jgi:hypothetical protein